MNTYGDDIIYRILRSPILAGVSIIFGVIAGMIATLFHDQLFDAFPLAYLRYGFDVTYGSWSSLAFWFWLFLGAFASISVAKSAISASDHRQEMLELEDLIENVAPPDFLKDYELTYIKSVTQERIALLPATENADAEFRFVLDGIIQLAARWDYNTSDPTDVYRANVMIDRADKTEWDDQMRAAAFSCYGENEWPAVETQAEGGLWVNRDLATADEADGLPDEEVTPLLLVYRRNEDVDLNIGGAPVAFVSEEMQYVSNTNEFLENFPSGLPENSRVHMDRFYRQDEKARSIISLPIPGEDRIIAVLNIYRNSPGIMGSSARARKFAMLLAPFTVILGRILVQINVTH
ncbi:membrane protein of unknown function [uncultured Woeseiaceae bacterium]|uniref:Uncharacterized protein n=1 Tax=uncultured Woeseiaceae bacterium TaxID=1983305 RepID=A0A7D9H3B3_9GAMM|nr:membrane protein of unknown function [uncultured Woeseiaceae bacterium]